MAGGRGLLLVVALLASFPASGWAQERAAIGDWGVETAELSTSVRPGDDFYRYVNEGWLAKARIPEGLAGYDDGVRIYLSNEARIRELVSSLTATTAAAGTPEQQIADMYRSYADADRLNALGIQPIQADLDAIQAASTRQDLARLMANPWQSGPIAAGVAADPGDPTRQIPAIVQSGLTLPGAEYYLQDGEPYEGQRSALREYIASSLRRAGVDDADRRAASVLALETEIARRHWSPAQRRDAVKMYHPMSPAELAAYAPGFEWDVYLQAQGFQSEPRLDLRTDTAVQQISALFAETPVETWKSYLLFHAIDDWAESLSDDWQEAYFDFHSRRLQGVPQRRAAADRVIQGVNGAMGEQIGRLYVQKWFSDADRAEVSQMVDYIRAAFRERIGQLEWMDEPTRREALAKLDKVASHVGYPDRWHDFSALEIRSDDLVGNQKRIMEWRIQDARQQLGQPRRDWEWPYAPQEVNAGYMSSLNSITFPAGILQPPYFDPAADPAVNFGAIAAVMGHEFGHAFDDQGSRSDGDGRLRDWWTPQSRQEFERRTAGLVDQFNAYEPLPGVKINGRQNLGENIGDLGGLTIAYDAYRRFVRDQQGGTAPVIDGFTGDQRFFMAWAQVWRNRMTPDEERRRVLADNHSAGEFRVNGIVRNLDPWYAAYDVKPGDALYLAPENRVRIW